MALQNIGAANHNDAFYRYKMPRLVTKIEGRGNGIKTNVVNMVEVAKALARPPSYTTKFFGTELGAQSKYDEKTGTSIVNGAHETAKLAGLLEIFIKKYVQCYNCGNPETTVNVSKSQMITLNCAACGSISNVDMRDKLTTFIQRNPPEDKKRGKDKALRRAEKERLKEGEIADKVIKKKEKKSHDEGKVPKKKSGSDEEVSSRGDEEEVDDVGDDDDDVEWQTDASVDAAKKRILEQLTSAASEMIMTAAEDQPVSPSAKSLKEAKSKSEKKSPSLKKGEVAIHPEEPPKVEEMSLHCALVNEFKALLQKGTSASQLAAVLKEKKEDPPQEVMNAYFEALFGDEFFKGIAKEVSSKKLYLSKAVVDEGAQLRLLVTLQMVCESSPSDVGKEIALVLKVLYDEEILEEDQILEWFDNCESVDPKTVHARKCSHPFVTWLRDAEADDDEDE